MAKFVKKFAALHIQIPALHEAGPVLDEGQVAFGLAAHEAFDGFGGLALFAGRGLGLDHLLRKSFPESILAVAMSMTDPNEVSRPAQT